MVSSEGASVFFGVVPLPPSNEQAQVWIMAYVDERFEKIYGGAIQLSGNNVPITFISNSLFINNFGKTGAALNLNRGGGIYVSATQFKFEKAPFMPEGSSAEQIYETSMLDIYTTYSNTLA